MIVTDTDGQSVDRGESIIVENLDAIRLQNLGCGCPISIPLHGLSLQKRRIAQRHITFTLGNMPPMSLSCNQQHSHIPLSGSILYVPFRRQNLQDFCNSFNSPACRHSQNFA
jgi:hypothetical protein